MISDQNLLLLKHMADGEFHSGEVLGEILGVSRAAVWKHLQGLDSVGVEIESVRGRGYRILGGLSLLSHDAICHSMADEVFKRFDAIHMLTNTASTNKFQLEQIAQNNRQPLKSACLSEMQTAGRGRRGRQWQSPFARNIYMSVAWPFENGIAAMEGLSLAVGVAIVEALNALGVEGVGLKWPNDVLYQNAKLGGVLIEIDGDVSGQCHAVVGIGLNVSMPNKNAELIDQAWVDLESIITESIVASTAKKSVPPRNDIAATLLTHLVELLVDYEQKSFASYQKQWESYAAHIGSYVDLVTPSKTTTGLMVGVDEKGAVVLEVDGERINFVGGEISLRLSQ